MDQAKYAYGILSRAHDSLMQSILSKSEDRDSSQTEGLIVTILEWVALTLESADAFLLSWPDLEGEMRIQEPAYVVSPTLKQRRSITCFDKLAELLAQEEKSSLEFDTTTEIEPLQKAGIESIILTKIMAPGQSGFTGKGLLVVCNRKKPVFERRMYVGYDILFCNIARWMLQLYVSELYHSAYERHENAKARYRDAETISSLFLVAETASSLLRVYSRYSASPPEFLIYDCLDAHIALFNARQIDADILEAVLVENEQWLAPQPGSQDGGTELIRHLLARGYFTVGLERAHDWHKGKSLLESN